MSCFFTLLILFKLNQFIEPYFPIDLKRFETVPINRRKFFWIICLKNFNHFPLLHWNFPKCLTVWPTSLLFDIFCLFAFIYFNWNCWCENTTLSQTALSLNLKKYSSQLLVYYSEDLFDVNFKWGKHELQSFKNVILK